MLQICRAYNPHSSLLVKVSIVKGYRKWTTAHLAKAVLKDLHLHRILSLLFKNQCFLANKTSIKNSCLAITHRARLASNRSLWQDALRNLPKTRCWQELVLQFLIKYLLCIFKQELRAVKAQRSTSVNTSTLAEFVLRIVPIKSHSLTKLTSLSIIHRRI